MKMYMAVTTDAYELPLCVEEKAMELAKRLGISENAVYAACVPRRAKQRGTHRGYKIIRIETHEKRPALQREPDEPSSTSKDSIHSTT